MKKYKIAYQGKPGAYSHMACLQAFPQSTPISARLLKKYFLNICQETDISLIQ